MAEEGGKDADGVLSLRRQKGIERGGRRSFWQAGCYLWEGRWNEEGDEGEKGRRWIFFLVYRVLSLRWLKG